MWDPQTGTWSGGQAGWAGQAQQAQQAYQAYQAYPQYYGQHAMSADYSQGYGNYQAGQAEGSQYPYPAAQPHAAAQYAWNQQGAWPQQPDAVTHPGWTPEAAAAQPPGVVPPGVADGPPPAIQQPATEHAEHPQPPATEPPPEGWDASATQQPWPAHYQPDQAQPDPYMYAQQQWHQQQQQYIQHQQWQQQQYLQKYGPPGRYQPGSRGGGWSDITSKPRPGAAAAASPGAPLSVAAVKRSLQAASPGLLNPIPRTIAEIKQSLQGLASASAVDHSQQPGPAPVPAPPATTDQPADASTGAALQQEHATPSEIPDAQQAASSAASAALQPQPAPPAPLGQQQQPQTARSIADVKQSLEALRPVIDANRLMRQPGRASRPPHVLIVLRGLPGSGKSYLAKRLREVEVEEGGEAPRVHALDDYFMTEVEVEVAEEGARGKANKKRTATEQQYQYDASMADTYQRSLAKAVCRTLEEGRFPLVVMDAPNMRLEQWQDVLPACQRHQYAVFVMQPLETDPALCASRNVHGHTVEYVTEMAASWEPPPPSISLLDARPLLQGKLQVTSHIDEVEMDDGGAGAGQEGGEQEGEGAAAQDTPAASAALASRWAQGTDRDGSDGDDDNGGPKKKKLKKTAENAFDSEILKAVEEALGDDSVAGSSGLQKRKKILKSEGQSSEKKRVRWCDEEPGEADEAGGFQIQPRVMPLCEVHELHDLGPAKGDTALQYMDATSPLLSGRYISFAEQVRAEHEHEHELLSHSHFGEANAVNPGADEEEEEEEEATAA